LQHNPQVLRRSSSNKNERAISDEERSPVLANDLTGEETVFGD